VEEQGPSIIERLQPGALPVPPGILVNAATRRQLAETVAAILFDPPMIEPLRGHHATSHLRPAFGLILLGSRCAARA
jgi:hypothetical protein